MLKIWCGENKNSKWGGILLALVMSLSVTFGFWGAESVKAEGLDSDYWTRTTRAGVSIKLVSLEQNGVEYTPVWNEYMFNWDIYDFGDYYFPIANNTDKVRVGILVNGIPEGLTYTLFDDMELTSEDNGTVVYHEQQPDLFDDHMEDSFAPGEGMAPTANDYMVGVRLYDKNGADYAYMNLMVRPVSTGSKNIEIVSVKQNGNEVYLDTVGRQVKTYDELWEVLQTINEYALYERDVPIEMTITFKNLEVGQTYSFDIDGEYESFVATATEETFTREIDLDYSIKHIEVDVNLHDPNGDDVSNYVRVFLRLANPLQDVAFEEGVDKASVAKFYGDEDFHYVATTNDGGGAITYTSDNEGVATVDAGTGMVAIVGIGNACITATAAETSTYSRNSTWYCLEVGRREIAVIEGDGQKHIRGVDGAAVFEMDAEYDWFENGGEVYLDDELVAEENYESWSGSTVVSFNADYLDSLALGEHQLTVIFGNNGIARATLQIADPDADGGGTDGDGTEGGAEGGTEGDTKANPAAGDTGVFTGVSGGAIATGASIIAMSLVGSVLFLVRRHNKD